MAGQDVRLVSLRGDAGVGLGIFQDTHGMKDAGTFARHLQDTTQAHFGTAGRAFLTKLTAERGSDPEGLVEAVKVMRDAFVASHLPCGADGQVRSVCARFGVVAAAGELARVFGIVLWPEGEATRASAACFKSWLADRGGSGAAEDVKAMRQVRAFIAAHDTSRFEEISDDSGPPSDLRTFNRAGFRRRGPNGWTYLIFPEVWRDDVCRGLDHQRTAKLLTSRNLLTPDADGRPDRKESVPTHGRPRFFVVVGTILEASDE
jgi:putative DNA primase/helicase